MPTANARPDYISPEDWNLYDDAQKAAVADPQSKIAQRAAAMVRPPNIPVGAWENRPLYQQLRLVNQYESQVSAAARSKHAEGRQFGFWTAEQEAAIEYLKRPLPKARHDMDTHTGRIAYAIESRTPVGERTMRLVEGLGGIALEAAIRIGDVSDEMMQKAAPIAKKALKTSLRAALSVTKKGMDHDERMIGHFIALERGMGHLALKASQRMQLPRRGKHTGAYIADRLKRVDDWLDEE